MRAVIFGLAKTGTTGLYQTLKRAMQGADSEFVCLFEPKSPKPWEVFFRISSGQLGLLSKAMLKPRFFQGDALGNFDKRIMLVRDPRDRLLSAFLFRALSRPGHVAPLIPDFVTLLREKESDPKRMPFMQLVRQADSLGFGETNLERIAETLRYQIDLIRERDFFVMKYEDFVSHAFEEINGYLGLELSANASQDSWLKHIERSKDYGEWRQWFTPSDIDELRPLLQPLMSDLGYEDDWELPETQVINPQNSSEYVQNNFQRRKEQMKQSSRTDRLPASQEEFELALARAQDGRLEDSYRVGQLFEEERSFVSRDTRKALDWYQVGVLFGHTPSREAARRLIEAGERPSEVRAVPIAKWIEKFS